MAHPFTPVHRTIRLVQPQHRAAVLTIVAASGLFPPDDMGDIAATLDQYLTGKTSGERWIIAADGNADAGVAYYAPERMTDGTWNLYLLAIHPDHQRKGHGEALVRHVERDLQGGSQARLLLIETSGVAEFAGQRQFYVTLGYQQEGRIREFYAIGDDKIIFSKPLKSARNAVPD